MKVKTNLSSRELDLVGKGLQLLAKSKVKAKKYPLENPAERELLRQVEVVLSSTFDSLQESISSTLLDD